MFTKMVVLLSILVSALIGSFAESSSRPVFNASAAPFFAKCDGVSDDTMAIQSAEKAADSAGGGVVSLPRGRCILSTGIAWDSGVSLLGAGSRATTLVASRSFGFHGNRVRRGRQNGAVIGMIWLDGPTETAPLHDVTIRDLGFDPRAGTQTYALSHLGVFQCIIANIRPLERVTFENLYFDLGSNPSIPTASEANGPKGFFGIELPDLGVDPDHPSHDITVRNIAAHNGAGTVQMFLGGYTNDRGIPPRAYNITINGVRDFEDADTILDDRVIIGGVTRPIGGPLGEVYNVHISHINTYVADSVRGGYINGLKLNPEQNTVFRGISVDGITFHGSSGGAYGTTPRFANHWMGSGSPFVVDATDSGFVQSFNARNIRGTNSMDILLELGAPHGESIDAELHNVTLSNCVAAGAGIAINAFTPATGRDRLLVDTFSISAAAVSVTRRRPRGLLLEARPNAGLSGDLQIVNGVVDGYPTPIELRSGLTGLRFRGVTWTTGQPALHAPVLFQ